MHGLPVIVEYWQGPDGRFFAESRHHPISTQAASLADLRVRIADEIRDRFRGSPLPSVYDLVPRRDSRTT